MPDACDPDPVPPEDPPDSEDGNGEEQPAEQSADPGGDAVEEKVAELAVSEELRAWHNCHTERLKVYATLFQATLPRIGAGLPLESNVTVEIDDDVTSARNLALVAMFQDTRRIAQLALPCTSGSTENRP